MEEALMERILDKIQSENPKALVAMTVKTLDEIMALEPSRIPRVVAMAVGDDAHIGSVLAH